MRRTVIICVLGAAGWVGAAAQQPAFAPTPPRPLPRAVGPVHLGMPAQQFTRLAHQPPDCTPQQNCGPHEARSTAFIDTLPPESGGLPAVQHFDCAFIRDTMYLFTTLPDDRRLAVMRSRFTAVYGAPAREDTTEAGLGEIIWESRGTRMSILYVRAENPAGQTPGTVTGVEIMDVRLGKLAEKDRGDKPWP